MSNGFFKLSVTYKIYRYRTLTQLRPLQYQAYSELIYIIFQTYFSSCYRANSIWKGAASLAKGVDLNT